MLSKCQCLNCSGPLEYDAADFQLSHEADGKRYGQMIDCPHCQKQTMIYMEKSGVAFFKPAKEKSKYSTVYLIIAAVFAVIVFGVLLYIYGSAIGSWVESIFPMIPNAIMGLVALVIAIGALILAVLWIVFPLLVLMKFNRVIELLEQIMRTNRR